MASPYKNIQDRISLPKKKKLQDNLKIFKPLQASKQEDGYELSEPLFNKTNDLVEELNKALEVYQYANEYRFTFPDSMFPSVPPGQRNNIRYEQKMVAQQENTFNEKLAEQQLKDIEETGQFKVKSNIQYITLPYVWQINPSLFWGKKKVREIWVQSLGKIFGVFWQAKKFMAQKVPQHLQKLAQYPRKFLDLLVGLKSIKTVVSVDYQREIWKDFWSRILNQYYLQSEEWGSSIWKYLYVYNNPELSRPMQIPKLDPQREKMQQRRKQLQQQLGAATKASNHKKDQILNIHQQFEQEWEKLKQKLIIQITEEVNAQNLSGDLRAESQQELLINELDANTSTDDKILQKLAQTKFTLYVQHMKTQLPKKSVPLEVIKAIVFILRLFNVIQAKLNKHSKLRQTKRQQTMKKIRSQHKIKSLFPPYLSCVLQKQMENIDKVLDQQLFYSLLKDKDMADILRKDQTQAIKEYIKLRFGHDALIAAKTVSVPQYHAPSRVFSSNDLTIDTNANFWKFKLYWMRFKTWSINFIAILAIMAWNGPWGLRCLWGTADFNCEKKINHTTGEIYYETRSTVIGHFNSVLDGVERSRINFEQTPDLGLLGKKMSRFANYFECYIFRFLFVGVILTLIVYPILILLASSLSLILVLTFWAWIPLIMAVCYLFNILINQFEIAQTYNNGSFGRAFPLLRLFKGILWSILTIIFSIFHLILIAPIIALFLFVFCLIQNLFRRVLDSILLFAFKHGGRTPSTDTKIAKKISGPGVTKEFYMSINQQDVYILIQGKMEVIYLRQFDKIIRQKINQNAQRLRKTIEKVLKPFGPNYFANNLAATNAQELNANYSRQYSQYCNRYPDNPINVRFTQEQIDSYFENTVNIVRKFVDKNEMGCWIFERYQLYEGMYEELTRSVWMQVFGCGQEIFQPLEKLDSRFKLQDQYKQADGFNYQMKRGVGSVMRALEGEVKLVHSHKKLTPFKHSLLSRQLPVQKISQILAYQEANSINNVQTINNDIKALFVPNLNIKDIITIQDQARIRRIKQQKYIIDL